MSIDTVTTNLVLIGVGCIALCCVLAYRAVQAKAESDLAAADAEAERRKPILWRERHQHETAFEAAKMATEEFARKLPHESSQALFRSFYQWLKLSLEQYEARRAS